MMDAICKNVAYFSFFAASSSCNTADVLAAVVGGSDVKPADADASVVDDEGWEIGWEDEEEVGGGGGGVGMVTLCSSPVLLLRASIFSTIVSGVASCTTKSLIVPCLNSSS